MIRNAVVGVTACIFICWTGSIGVARQPGALELFGQGVHAYFSGDYEQAIARLTQAIDKNETDPRAYFFRGLATVPLQGGAAAAADFAKGAAVEANADTPMYDVDAALQRVQGALRMEIENQRKAARKAAVERKKKRARARYEQLERREKEVLFNPDRPLPKIDFTLPKPKMDVNPFANDLMLTGGKQVQVQAAATPAQRDGGVREPFAAPAAQPTAQPATEQPKDPFATGGKKNPFDSSAKPPPPKAPAPTAPAAPKNNTNPFGEMAPAPDNAGAAEKPDAGDPFGEDHAPPAPPSENGGGGAKKGMFDDLPPKRSSTAKAMGTVVDILGKTLSGQGAKRDPFGESTESGPDTGAKPAVEKEAGTPATNPFGAGTPAPPKAPAPPKPAGDKKPADAPVDNPFK